MIALALATALMSVWSAAASAVEVKSIPPAPSLEVMVAKYTQCLVRKHHDEAKAYILSEPVAGAGGNKFPVQDKACLAAFDGYEVSFIYDMYRDGLASALMAADFAARGNNSFSDRAPLAHPAPVNSSLNRSDSGRSQERADLSRIAECVARANPEAARLWSVTSPTEAPDLGQDIGAMFDRCAKQMSVARIFNPEIARGPIARAYYRLANAPVVQDSGAIR
jgi:hypothetical protein